MLRAVIVTGALGLSLGLGLGLAAPALAQEAETEAPYPAYEAPAGSWAGVIGVASDNRHQGQSRTGGEPSIRGLLEWSSGSGLVYLAGEVERDTFPDDHEAEVTAVIGIRPQLAGYDLDISLAQKWYPGSDINDDGETEVTADVSRSIGPADARLRLQYTPDMAGPVEAVSWVELDAGWRFRPDWRASAAIGARDQSGGVDYTAWTLGATWSVRRNIDLDLRWYGNDADLPDEAFDNALVLAVDLYF